jgi:hypothetical protein
MTENNNYGNTSNGDWSIWIVRTEIKSTGAEQVILNEPKQILDQYNFFLYKI